MVIERMTPAVRDTLLDGIAGRGHPGRSSALKNCGGKTGIVVVMSLEDLKYSLCNWASTKPMVCLLTI